MADIPRDEFIKRIGLAQPAASTNQAITNAVPLASELTLAPLSKEALNKQTESYQRGRLDVGATTSDWSSKVGARPGIPMDMETGIPFMRRLRLAAQPTEEEEVKALEAAYGPGKVRRNSFGWLIVEKPGPNGKPEDVLVDPIGVDMGDLANIAMMAPELVGGMFAALKWGGRAPGVLNAFKTLVASAAGTGVAGAAKDTLVRGLEGESPQFSETGVRRGVGAGLDVAIGGTAGVGAKVATKLISPFSNIGTRQFNARAAQQHFRNKTGIVMPLTPAEATGNSFLQKAEAQQMQKPGASLPFEDIMREKERTFNEVQREILGGPVPDEEAAGQRALNALGARFAPLEQDVQRSALAARNQASQELIGGVGVPVDKTVVGTGLRNRAEAIRQEYRTERDALYNVVESDPRTQVKNISGDELANEAERLMGRQVSIQTQVPGPILGPTGRPIPVTTNEVLEEFSETGIIPKINALRRARGQDFRLDELIKMRRSIDNEIAIGEANPGVKPRELGQLRQALTQRITTGLNAIDPQLRQNWQVANDYVANNVGRFNQKGIAELFRDAEQGSYLGETALVDRVTSGGSAAQDIYGRYREFFGANSPEMQGVVQSIRDETFGRDRIEGLIDAKGFGRRITQLAKDVPAAFNDAFGNNAAALRNSARALEAAQGGIIPEDELIRAMNSGNLSGRTLQEMIAAQSKKNVAYRNDLIKSIGDGSLKGDSIKPTELVRRMVFDDRTQPSELQQVISAISGRPDVLEDIRRLTFKKVLDDASTLSRSTGTKIWSGEDIEKLITNENTSKRLRSALGNDTFNDLVALKDYLIPGELMQQAAKTAGGLSAGSQVSSIVETGALRTLDKAAKNFVVASIYTLPSVRRLLTNNILGPQEQALAVKLAIVSAPFVEAAISEFGPEGAKAFMRSVNNSFENYAAEQGQTETKPTASPSREDFMRRIGVGAPAQP